MKSDLTTLCYIERDDAYLMLHRVKKKNDVNQDKWIGIGGHFESGESPEECLLREAFEETGLRLIKWQFRGIVTFCFREAQQAAGANAADAQQGQQPRSADDTEGSTGAQQPLCEYMHLYTATEYEGELADCNEGVLEWVPKAELDRLNLWEGDRIFFELLRERRAFFSLKLSYVGDKLCEALLDGKPLELIDIRDENGNISGQARERGLVHRLGTWHATAHVWICRRRADGGYDLLLQKRSMNKESFPGCLDISSAGHIPAGGDELSSALRELHEELGLRADAEALRYAGQVKVEVLREFHGKPYHDREISAVYVWEYEPAPEEMRLQEEEVESVLWMDHAAVLARVQEGDEAFCINPVELRLLGEFLKESKLPCE